MQPFQKKQKTKDFESLDASEVSGLREGHENLPLWVTPEGTIILEAFSPYYLQVLDFVVAIAQPVHRTHLIHEYQINKYSMYAAVSIGLPGDLIIAQLRRISKTVGPNNFFS